MGLEEEDADLMADTFTDSSSLKEAESKTMSDISTAVWEKQEIRHAGTDWV